MTATGFMLPSTLHYLQSKKSLSTTASTVALCEGAATSNEVEKFAGTAFYPPIKAYHKGMLQVSSKHSIAYSLYGNPKGKPVLFVHGGPGGGTDPAVSIVLFLFLTTNI